MYFKAFALTGRIADWHYTQGVALGYELLPFQGVLLIWAAWPSVRCCLYWLLGLHGVAAMAFNYPVRPFFVRLKLPSTPFCTVEIIQHTLLYG